MERGSQLTAFSSFMFLEEMLGVVRQLCNIWYESTNSKASKHKKFVRGDYFLNLLEGS